jgi:hypothetical protein
MVLTSSVASLTPGQFHPVADIMVPVFGDAVNRSPLLGPLDRWLASSGNMISRGHIFQFFSNSRI